jgi:predicted DNA-binding ribbon-helix-helix protein
VEEKKTSSNMGRPKLWKDPVRKLITLESHQWDKLERIAARKGFTGDSAVLTYIRRWVDRQKV